MKKIAVWLNVQRNRVLVIVRLPASEVKITPTVLVIAIIIAIIIAMIDLLIQRQ